MIRQDKLDAADGLISKYTENAKVADNAADANLSSAQVHEDEAAKFREQLSELVKQVDAKREQVRQADAKAALCKNKAKVDTGNAVSFKKTIEHQTTLKVKFEHEIQNLKHEQTKNISALEEQIKVLKQHSSF